MNIQTCIDCNAYDDADRVDSFMMSFGDDKWVWPFGDDKWVCRLCAQYRGIEL